MKSKAKQRIVIFGSKLHAGPVLELIQLAAKFEIVGFVDSDSSLKGKEVHGIPVLGGDELIPKLKKMGVEAAALGMGYDYKEIRMRLYETALRENISFPNFIHPKAIVSDFAIMGEGNVVMAGAVINPYCKIGNICVVNTNCSLDHDCILQDNSFVSPGVAVGGKVTIGKNSFIGIGSCVVDRLKIGNNTYLGAGSVVVENIPDGVKAYGNPARTVRTN